jgi:hypothetical protein
MRTKGVTQQKVITLLGGAAYALSVGNGNAGCYKWVSVGCSPGSPPAKVKHTCSCWTVPTDTGWATYCSYGWDTYRNGPGRFSSCLKNQPNPSYNSRSQLVPKVCSYTQYKTDGCSGAVTPYAKTIPPVNGFNCYNRGSCGG